MLDLDRAQRNERLNIPGRAGALETQDQESLSWSKLCRNRGHAASNRGIPLRAIDGPPRGQTRPGHGRLSCAFQRRNSNTWLSRTFSAETATFEGRSVRSGMAAGGRGVAPSSLCSCPPRWAAYARISRSAEKAEPPVDRAAMTANPSSKRFMMPSATPAPVCALLLLSAQIACQLSK